MLSLPPSVRLFVATQAVDGRKGADSLMVLVRDVLQLDPLSGDLFLFSSKRRSGCKVLVWETARGFAFFKSGSSVVASRRCSATTARACSSRRVSSRFSLKAASLSDGSRFRLASSSRKFLHSIAIV